MRRVATDRAPLLTASDRTSEVAADEARPTRGDAGAIERVVTKLVQNAVAHGGRHVIISVPGSVTEVEDDGPRIPPMRMHRPPLHPNKDEGTHMRNFNMHRSPRRALPIGVALAVAAVMLSSIATAQPRLSEDQQTCADMGASPGSSGHTACMLQQQRRRDQKMLRFLEEQRIHSELGRAAREKLEEKRARRERDNGCPR